MVAIHAPTKQVQMARQEHYMLNKALCGVSYLNLLIIVKLNVSRNTTMIYFLTLLWVMQMTCIGCYYTLKVGVSVNYNGH